MTTALSQIKVSCNTSINVIFKISRGMANLRNKEGSASLGEKNFDLEV